MSDVTCRGSFALGTACGRCSRCRREIESYNAMKSVRDKLNTPSSAISRIEELEAQLAKAVEALRFYGGVMPVSFSPGQDGGEKARNILAELKGDKKEARMSNPKKPNLVGTGVQKGFLKTPVYDAEFFEAEAKALRAENERLREALKIVDRNLTNLQPKIPDMVYGDWIKVIDAYVDPAISASRQALKGNDDE